MPSSFHHEAPFRLAATLSYIMSVEPVTRYMISLLSRCISQSTRLTLGLLCIRLNSWGLNNLVGHRRVCHDNLSSSQPRPSSPSYLIPSLLYKITLARTFCSPAFILAPGGVFGTNSCMAWTKLALYLGDTIFGIHNPSGPSM